MFEKKKEFRELSLRYTEYLQELVRDPEKTQKTLEVGIVSRVKIRGEK